MLVALQKVPHLAEVCVEKKVLKQLRSNRSEALPHANGLISGLTVEFEAPFAKQPVLSLLTVNQH